MLVAGSNCVITGASSGIGAHIAQELSKRSVNVALLARREDKLRQVAEQCTSATSSASSVHIITMDMNDTESVDRAVERIGELFCHKVHYLINCAGMGGENVTVDELDVDKCHQILTVNLVNMIRFTLQLIKYIKGCEPAAIVNIGSIVGTIPWGKLVAYGASKYGVRGFSQNLFEDLREHGVKVCVIQPGLVATEMVPESELLDRSKMIQVQDITDTIMYVLNCRPTVCPTEINLSPQRSPAVTPSEKQ